MPTKEPYINLFTDYGFKKIFGEELKRTCCWIFSTSYSKRNREKSGILTYLKTEQLGDTDIDCVIRNLNRLERIPDMLREQVFEQLFDTAEIARFTPDQVHSYEKSLKYYRDMKNSLDTAFYEGKEEGIEIGMETGKEIGKAEGQREIVINGLKQGLDVQIIAALTDLSIEAIEKIAQEIQKDEESGCY